MIKTISSTLVYQNPWTTVREDVVERADGSRGLYGVIDKIDFTLVIAREGDQLWLVEQYRYPVQGRYAEFPQGAWHEKPDADPQEVAAGELREEAGLIAAHWEKLGFFYCAYGMASHGCHVYLATGLSETERAPEITEQGHDGAQGHRLPVRRHDAVRRNPRQQLDGRLDALPS